MTRDAAIADPLAFEAVPFDMDGTLADTEPIWFAVLRAVVPERLVVDLAEARAMPHAAGATCLFVTNAVVDVERARAIMPHVVRSLPTI